MDYPKISIITVVFNDARNLSSTIQSVKGLSYPNVEYIVVDGDSTDGSVEIIKENAELISQWISEPDHGLYDAMNKGLDMASGEYVWFINAGDEPGAPGVLEKIFGKGEKADIYYGETMLIDDEGNEIGLRRLSPPENLNWRHFRHGMLVGHQSFIPAREVVKKYDLRFKFSADFDWCLYALRNASNIRNTHMVLSHFREGGLTKQNIIPGLKERFRIMVKNFGFFSTLAAHIIIAPKFFYFWLKNKRF
ncbi:glycosyltransferase family 2 protein [Marinilabilia rubra]|uniref:Glycosyl transferase n=1 Tax=Marinilabilia rubra TaxID=2162893 RepID=A0A2U2B9A8_9BACT|nr:glycosyltransferase family 2 protein [Marinilabilia rubra]PWD99661.1 glycosyl transferase [Marinilabilia rubra]